MSSTWKLYPHRDEKAPSDAFQRSGTLSDTPIQPACGKSAVQPSRCPSRTAEAVEYRRVLEHFDAVKIGLTATPALHTVQIFGEQKEIVECIVKMSSWIDRLASETTSARKLIDHLDQSILAKAFRGELVPQNPNDEPASVLLERIRVDLEVKSSTKRPTIKKKK
jgi:hypothetical protein